MTTEAEYRVRLDRAACEGVFACLVRDDRFREAADGLATLAGAGDDGEAAADGELIAGFADDRLAEARQAARACPVDAISVTEAGDE
jgi:ferredoxin